MSNDNPVIYHIMALFVVAVWGTTFIASKVLLDHGLMPADIFFYRFLLAYLCILLVNHKQMLAENWKDEIYMALTGIFGGSLYFLAENTALQVAQASDVSILVSSSPIFTSIVLALFYQSERMSRRQTLGMLIAFIGMIFIVLNGQFILHVSVVGYLLAIGAALTWALYNLFMKKVMHKYSSQFISRKVFFYGILSIMPYYALVSPLKFDLAILSETAVWGCLLFLGLLASMYCYVIWNTAMANLGAVKTTVYLYMAPLFTIITAYIILHERITWMAILGTVILLTGMVLAEKKSKKQA